MADQPTENVPNTSLRAVVATLTPTLAVSVVYFAIFLVLRKSHRRYYSPRSYLGTLREEERTEKLPNGWLDWIGPFIKVPSATALKRQSLDAYFFLRYLKITVIIMFFGVLITWPILFPVYITGGLSSGQLDMLSMGNIDRSGNGQYRYYASAIVGWIYFTFVLILITRETIYFINLRQAFLLSPFNSNRISSRTVLFSSVPVEYRDEVKLRKMFGASVKRVWLNSDTSNIDELVEERDRISMMLENAEINLIKTANSLKLKATKENKNRAEASSEKPEINESEIESGSLVNRWVKEKKRPSHKLGLFGLLGQRVDTINWCRSRLDTLIPATKDAQILYKKGESEKLGGVFIEFSTQSDAQSALQTLSHHQALQMSPKFIGICPSEIIWSSLQIPGWQRVVRRIAVIGLISTLIIFWAIPVGFVGLLSNVNYLKHYSFLSWLDKIPSPIMNLITGLLPAVALGILMSLVPVIIRLLAKVAGEPSLTRVELFTQNAYFIFQVVQVFLVATVASAATALLKQAFDDPGSITGILANKIPKASNFYLSYFIVQGLTVASGVICQVVGFVIFTLMYKFLARTPRSLYQKWASLSTISWGSTLPVFTNIAVIGITYSCIAPLVLGFAGLGMSLFYLAYRYNILFVSDSAVDTKGLIYPRALKQLLTGVYISELCLLGLFTISRAIGPIILMVIYLVLTILYHQSFNSALNPLIQNLPKSLTNEERDFPAEKNQNDSEVKKSPSELNSETNTPPVTEKKPNIFAMFLAPHTHSDYTNLRKLVPDSGLDLNALYEGPVSDNAYFPPSVTSETPLIWIPKDNIGISSEEISETSRIIPITDEGATITDDNKILWDPEGSCPPIWRPKIYY